MRPSAALFVLVVAALLTGCGDDDGGTPDASRVVETPDLGSEPSCLDPTVPGGAVAPCLCGSDCAAGLLCSPEETSLIPGGSCERLCTSDTECGAGELCAPGEVRRCTPRCTASSECDVGRYCFVDRCTPLCQSDAQCLSGNCDRYSGTCLAPGVASMGAKTNEPCLRDEDCRSRICLDSVCLTPCARSAQGCPDGEFCLGDASLIDAGQCLPRCDTTADCSDPTAECLEVTDLGRTAKVCF